MTGLLELFRAIMILCVCVYEMKGEGGRARVNLPMEVELTMLNTSRASRLCRALATSLMISQSGSFAPVVGLLPK